MYLGLDLGTSGLRGIVVDDGGRVLADAEAGVETSTPRSGWSEQAPSDWIKACQKVVVQLRQANSAAFSAVRAIGLSGHMHGATLLDHEGSVLRPCILWNDTRSASEAAELDGSTGMREVTGNIVFPGFTAPKLEWVRVHEPEIFEKVSKVLLPKDYLRFWLTGEYISDVSDSAGTAWLDVGRREWSDTALELGHMRRDQMPQLVEGSAVGGQLRTEILQSWGLTGPVLIAGGAGDNAAAACGIGSIQEGTGFLSLGTSGVLLVAKESYAPAPETAVHCFCHAVPDRWIQMGVILSATNSLNWLSRNVGQPVSALASALPDRIDGPSDTTFLPYLSGERTPHNDSAIRGAFLGLDIAADPKALTQSVMEGVAFAMRDCLEALRGTGTTPQSLLVVGGGARSRFWLETLATALNTPLALPKGSEFGAATGAARLAVCASERADPKDIMTPPDISEVILPRTELCDGYDDAYERYRQYYRALSPLSVQR
ncbi:MULTISPECIES: xylulokinase [unclassified Ruegeria]|uniref:xylulokinase n=1 Tax=unclassified Ruegeria TaxID=2625375 RepID=UPI00148A0AEB|nr:xylulokinase [Ruegeria sp. HKCCD4318]NOE12459.1 xylulokinase [Ruegeria sp. HKCCD4318-2]NOG09376.1 xylulokinase [Ruegeria sp. HKCCD4315]